jgi:serine/threonine-protein kinase HipA
VTERGCELLDDIIGIGSIAGGARPKVALAFHPERRVFRSALNSLPAGYESWLLKFDGLDAGGRMSASAEYGKIEYAYYLMSKNAGINMSLCDLFEEHGRSHFMTRRFDRDETGTRFHVQSLCAMSHLDYHNRASFSYGNYFETLKGLNLPYNDFEEAYRRMIFNVFSFNCDDHTKNFSFLLRQGGSWELAPCYDITFSYNPTGNKIKQHAISVNGRFREICLNDLYAEARRYGIESARHIIAEVGRAIDMWGDFAQTAGISPQKLDEIYSILSSAKKNNRWIG